MLFNSEEYKADFFIDYKPYNKADLWVNNIGNSMSPVIENGDLLALQIKTDIQQIIYGEIYAIVMPEMRTIKYLRKSKLEGHVQFVPENLEDYDAQDMPIELIEKFFIVLGSIKKFF
jgi:phage repressor protein C with HTH and peptisase S24 domain